jgi:hypothetical protein
VDGVCDWLVERSLFPLSQSTAISPCAPNFFFFHFSQIWGTKETWAGLLGLCVGGLSSYVLQRRLAAAGETSLSKSHDALSSSSLLFFLQQGE